MMEGFLLLNVMHLAVNLSLALAHIRRWIATVKFYGVGQRGRNKGTLALGERQGIGIEMVLRHGLSAIDAIAHLDGVQIHFHYAFLAPKSLYQECEIRLQPFPKPR